MSELIIFCNPKQVYSGKLEQEVARDYTKMAIEDYDKLISFDKKYMTFVETPDYETVVGQKNGRNLLLILFANQPMIRIGSINNRFKSSSYLFNPESENEEVLLPDLDIVQIDGVSALPPGHANLYKANAGWVQRWARMGACHPDVPGSYQHPCR